MTMKQVLLLDGKAVVEEMPVPVVSAGRVLVRTAYSVLSAGTERSALRATEGPSLLRDVADPGRIRRAFEVLREEGPAGVLARLRTREEVAALAPGYAASGHVHAVGRGVSDLPPGTPVACAGAGFACHAEWIAVPRNLVVPVPPGLPLEEAAFATLGAIALQGVRRSGIGIGECAVVLGLGLIGSLAAQILRAAGARVLGFDLDPGRAVRCRALGIEAHDLAAIDPREEVPRATGGLSADAVLVCAASTGSEVVNLAMRLCRKKGRVVIVGDVGLQIDRSLLYEKELDLLISTSYGPGRYDPSYEEKGIDYPPAYVRWTENRNLAAFLRLVCDGSVRVRPLIDRMLTLDEAPVAYEAIDAPASGGAPLGVVLRYPAAPAAETSRVSAPACGVEAAPVSGAGALLEPLAKSAAGIGVGFCGAGDFVKAAHLPALRKARGFVLRSVATASPVRAREVARRFGVTRAAGDLREILADESVDLVAIGTRHDLHASQVFEALRARKHVFVEKPLCLDESDLGPLLDEARSARRLLAVGFNRRYSPLARRAREVLGRLSGPALAVYRVNAGALPPGHWVHDPDVGGGRIVGECCHFLDLLLYLTAERLEGIEARALPSDGARVISSDSFVALLDFSGGSRAVLAYTGLGDPGLAKERLEIFKGGASLVLDDFRRLSVHGGPGGSVELGAQDKGIAHMWEEIGRALRGGPSEIITLREVEDAMRATFRLDRAVRGER
jgi:predicted dehydrogenase/threonine dehydrogenase-like Zn-dependent dehydrogenase